MLSVAIFFLPSSFATCQALALPGGLPEPLLLAVHPPPLKAALAQVSLAFQCPSSIWACYDSLRYGVRVVQDRGG